MLRFALSLLFTSVIAGAAIAGPASLIPGYNGISVGLSRNAEECGLKGGDTYSDYLGDRLFAAKVPLDARQPPHARLALSAQPFAQIGGKCVIMATLSFFVTVEGKEVEVAESASKHDSVVAIFGQMKALPVVLYEDGEFTVSAPENGNTAALGLVENLARRFVRAR